jgi:Iap family predicted aminopeptidase
LANWALTNLEASHPIVMERVNEAMASLVPAAVDFAVSVIPRNGFFAQLSAGIEADDVKQLGRSVLARWPQAADAIWTYAISAARAQADALFGSSPVAATAATASD